VDAVSLEPPPIETEPIETLPVEPAPFDTVHDGIAAGQDVTVVAASGAEASAAAFVDRPESAQPAPKAGSRAPGRRAASNGRRGRRFTLPSIEVDHERTERVVLSLLSGDDEPGTGQLVDAWERLVGGEADGPGGRSAVVVALALDGLDAYAESGGRDAAERLLGGALDAIRRSARGSDRVASVGRGRFRVLLVDADSEVASRFVSRVRELADRRISLSGAPVRIAAGWAEATSAGSLDAAVRAAEDQRRRNLTAGGAAKRDVSPA
jgi:GGDEF domain-containing protein